jgi:thiamine biosynthesis lipoprotein
MLELLSKSAQVSHLTGGAFDITYASVGRYYDYRQGQRPDDAELEQGLAAINYDYVELDDASGRVRFSHPLVYIDLGGIAKGYAVDRCIELIAAAGIDQAAVAAGGDSRILGDRRGEPWTVGIQDPRQEDTMAVLLPLVDTAVSTSGDYERFFVEDGVRYHHIIDPSTGDSARDSWSVTILGSEATFTDALSTSVFVLGPERGLHLIDSLPGVDAIIIDASGKLLYSADLAEAAKP